MWDTIVIKAAVGVQYCVNNQLTDSQLSWSLLVLIASHRAFPFVIKVWLWSIRRAAVYPWTDSGFSCPMQKRGWGGARRVGHLSAFLGLNINPSVCSHTMSLGVSLPVSTWRCLLVCLFILRAKLRETSQNAECWEEVCPVKYFLSYIFFIEIFAKVLNPWIVECLNMCAWVVFTFLDFCKVLRLLHY